LPSRDRVAGLLLFLPVPIVLLLFTWQPIGAWASLGVGVVVMLTHRLYARPFALSRAGARCLWCGGPAGEGPAVEVDEPLGRTRWRTCGSAHASLLARTLGWATERRAPLAVGILGSLVLFLVGAAAATLGHPAWLEPSDAVAFFRLGIALTVLPFGWLAPESQSGPTRGLAPEDQPGPTRGLAPESRPGHTPGRLPFPVHIQALLGTLWVLWLFRLVGLWWLVASLLHLARRLA
jgi:hypothetical protein